MTDKEIEDLIANQLKAWLMHEPSWCRDGVRDSKGFADFTEKRSKDGGIHIARNLATVQMGRKYLADRGKLPS